MAEGDAWPWAEVHLARHGQTEWNIVGRRQGQLDSPLTAAGRNDADRIARIAAGLELDGVFASPQGRAEMTARVVAGHVGADVHVLDELAELDHGTFAGMTNAEIDERHPGELERRAADKWDWRFPGGESYADADERAAVALGMIAATGIGRPLVVSHEMITRVLVRRLTGVEPSAALRYGLAHGVVLRVSPRSGHVEQLGASTTPD